jgi:hypothetical protein
MDVSEGGALRDHESDSAMHLRQHALQSAVFISRELALPDPAPDWITRCQHRGNDTPCDCPAPTPEERQASAELIERGVVNQVIRIADQFVRWLVVGMGPEEWRQLELDDALDKLTGADD